jgi:hypothetical protein
VGFAACDSSAENAANKGYAGYKRCGRRLRQSPRLVTCWGRLAFELKNSNFTSASTRSICDHSQAYAKSAEKNSQYAAMWGWHGQLRGGKL